MNVCIPEKCTACMACINICPVKCIKLVYDQYGYEAVSIDEEKCIKCGKCHKMCPANNVPKLNSCNKVYAAACKNLDERKTSSSGGLAYTIAKNFVIDGGIVYASVYDKENLVEVRRIDNLDDLKLIKGSKYVISHMNETLSSLIHDLKSGLKVLIIGTPCQIDSIRKNVTNDNQLFCIDLVCHGVPSQDHLREYIKYLGLEVKNINQMYFRDANCYLLKIITDDGVKIKRMNESIYMKGFMKALFNRSSCYECKYACPERLGDITLGDFWGLGITQNKELESSDGVSLVMINSEKGKDLFGRIHQETVYEERKLEEALAGNAQLNAPSSKHRHYNKFRKMYLRYGFVYAAQKCLWFDMLKSRVREFLIKFL